MSPSFYATAVALGFMILITSESSWAENSKPPKAVRLCVSCHTFAKGEKPKIGPNLYGIYGSPAAANQTFTKYGQSMKDAATGGLVWTYEKLAAYITNPVQFLKAETGQKKVKTSMITRVRKAKDREAIIAYLKTLKD